MQTVVLKIKVEDEELGQLEQGLNELGADFQVVNKGANDVNDSIDKLGRGAKPILNELDKVTDGWASKVFDVGSGIAKVNTGLRASKTALIATGIGAFVVALGLIVAYWQDIEKLITGVSRKIEDQVDLTKSGLSVIESQIALLDGMLDIYDGQNEKLNEILDKKKIILENQQIELFILTQQLQTQLQQEASDARRQTFFENITGQKAKITDQERKDLNEIEIELNNAELRLLQVEQQLLNFESTRRDITNPNTDRADIANVEDSLTRDFERAEAMLEAYKKIEEERFDIQQQLQDASLKSSEEFVNSILAQDAKRTVQERMSAENRQKFRVLELEAKDELLQAEAGLLTQFSQFLAAFGEENKALAVASIVTQQIASAAQIISATGLANAKAVAVSPLTGGQPWVTINTISAGLSIATGAAAAGKAISQLGGSGGGGSDFSVGGGGASSTTPPAFNIVDSTAENQINSALLGRNSEVQEVFVTEGAVRTAAEARRNKVESTSI